MNVKEFVWHKLRLANRLPGAYSLFYLVADLIYRDGDIVTLRRGLAAGYCWRHYHGYQPWMAFGLYEPDVAQLIHRSLHSGDVFYDIGANAGYFTLIAAKAVGPVGKVIAFDPVPKNTSTIQEQIDINVLQDVCCVEPLAICDADGTAAFLIPRRNVNAHLADVEAPHVVDAGGDLIKVRCTTLDSYVSDNPWPTFIKMDIEGAEAKALTGATQLLASPQAPVFLITAHSEALAEQVRAILRQAGYEFSDFQHMIHAIPGRLGRPT